MRNPVTTVDVFGDDLTGHDERRERARVFVLDRHQDQADEIASHLNEFRYSCFGFSDVDSFWCEARQSPPDAVVVDIEFLSDPDFRAVLPALTRQTSMKVPVVVLSDSDDWYARVKAVRGGGSAFLAKPVDLATLIEELDGLIIDEENGRYRILIVDPSPLRSHDMERAMARAGMETHVIGNPSNLLEVLADFAPDLVLTVTTLPGCTAEEASAVIRQHLLHTNLPVVYLATEEDPADLGDALQLGGDDLFVGSMGGSRLVAIVEARARRYRRLKTLIGRDDLTGLLNHTSFKLALEREVARSLRRDSVLSVAMLDLDHFKSVNDRFGHPMGDVVIKSLSRLLSHRLRKGDVVARYGGEEFAVVLPDTPPRVAAELLDELRRRFVDISMVRDGVTFNVTLSVGIAALPPHEDVDRMITAADDAMYEAKRAGRNRVAIDSDTLAVES